MEARVTPRGFNNLNVQIISISEYYLSISHVNLLSRISPIFSGFPIFILFVIVCPFVTSSSILSFVIRVGDEGELVQTKIISIINIIYT